MARRRKKKQKTEYGEVTFSQEGCPVSFCPPGGVDYRIRDRQTCEELFAHGKMSPEDIRLCRQFYKPK